MLRGGAPPARPSSHWRDKFCGRAVAETCDVAVVGLGAVGSTALLVLARAGARAIGLDRFSPPHDRGSSHGESRIMRQAIGEGAAYVPLVLRSNALWETLEAVTGERLLERCGFLFITCDDTATSHHGKRSFLARTVEAAERNAITHEVLNAADIAGRFAQFTGLTGEEVAYFEPGGGFLRPERCIAAALAEAERLGATVRRARPVKQLIAEPSPVRLQTPEGTIFARKVILTAGPWMSRFLTSDLAARLKVHRQALHWFAVADERAYRSGSCPTFIWTTGLGAAEQFYGFPPVEGQVKVAREEYDGGFDPDEGGEAVDVAVGERMAADHVRRHLAGLSNLPVRARRCHYTLTPDQDFLIDRMGEDVMFASACSGHGFKHAAAVGEALADWALGSPPRVDLKPFGIARFASAPFPQSA